MKKWLPCRFVAQLEVCFHAKRVAEEKASLLGARFAGQCACVESEREKESDIMCVCVSVEEACPCDKERRKPTRDKGRIWERRACVGGLKIVKESLGERKKACACVCVRVCVHACL